MPRRPGWRAALAALVLAAPLHALAAAAPARDTPAIPDPPPPGAFVRAMDAWRAGDWTAARAAFAALAETRNHPQAAYMLARMAAAAQGGPRDVEGARHWLERAAEGGEPKALYLLGRQLLHGPPGRTGRDPERAIAFLERAERAALAWADLEAVAAANLALGMHYHRTGRYAEAAPRFRKAAEGGEPIAMFMFGAALFEGKGLPRDTRRAYAWIHRAAEAGIDGAAQVRDSIGALLDPGEIADIEAGRIDGRSGNLQ